MMKASIVRTSCGAFGAHGAISLACIACVSVAVANVIHMKVQRMALRIISFPPGVRLSANQMRAALLRQSCTTTLRLCNDHCRKTAAYAGAGLVMQTSTADTDALVLRGFVPALSKKGRE
jgi:hypothetical protein